MLSWSNLLESRRSLFLFRFVSALFACGFGRFWSGALLRLLKGWIVGVPVDLVAVFALFVERAADAQQCFNILVIDCLQLLDSRVLEFLRQFEEGGAILVDQSLDFFRTELDLRILRLLAGFRDFSARHDEEIRGFAKQHGLTAFFLPLVCVLRTMFNDASGTHFSSDGLPDVIRARIHR